EENLGTFGMQISGAVRLLQAHPQLLERERKRARFILIDEFQDCNSSNVILAELLAGGPKNIFAVGDPDQAIYRFRGASSAAFEEFLSRFPHSQTVRLSHNHRSTVSILRSAFSIIRQNPEIVSSRTEFALQRAALDSARQQL